MYPAFLSNWVLSIQFFRTYALNLNSDEGRDKLKDELDKAKQEGYVKDYEELILKYFEAVQEEATDK